MSDGTHMLASDAKRRTRTRTGAHTRKQMRYLGGAAQLERQGPPGVLILSLIAVIGLVATVLVWAAIARIPISVSAEGEVRPVEAVHRVQHLEGGIVSEVLVTDGALVERGQTLIRLEPATREADLEEMRARLTSLHLRDERLRALIENRAPDFSSFDGAAPTLVSDQLTSFVQARRTATDQQAVLAARRAQAGTEIERLDGQIAALEAEAAVFAQERTIRRALLDKRLISRLEFLQTEREYQRVSGQLEEARSNRKRAVFAIDEAARLIVEASSRRRQEWASELGLVAEEITQLGEAIGKFADRVDRLAVVAPISGTVNGLAYQTPGSVVTPGADLLGIVPLGGDLSVSARIEPEDIGHIKPGQPVDVLVSAFDLSRFGTLDGEIAWISADRLTDEQSGARYYEARIALATPYIEEVRHDRVELHWLRPGMSVTTNVRTGTRTFLEYLLKPIYQSLGAGFTER